ncbi:cullin-domain-containing protein [Stemphylium lycopersici]|uniref:Cullin-domain-containing protein n=1 Tax=Stemphylium lycopersici TaxID=183478 RepID=A0A364N294_STELY|nr:cullin-domain-containing protein [Stemphylium lycopersici]RAR02223.1 cullin-domain-containing protein [Stemphylium lycopersici]RAR10006.1 cullin-domain-containing protein [Stemphylium lycopersici]
MIAGRGRQRIRPPRRGLHGDEIDFENTWGTIEAAFREIHTKNASKLSYEELYRHAYRIVLKKKGENLYNKVHEFERNWLSTEVRSTIQQLLSPNLLVNAQSVSGTTANERRVAGEKFLKGLRQAWGDHQICTSMLADVLMYMDRVYCADHRRPSIYNAAMVLFRDEILNSTISAADARTILGLLNHIVLDQIQMERDGDVIDKQLIKSCVWMLEGLHEGEMESEEQRLYNTSFEKEYLDTSSIFYRGESELLLRDSHAGAYCKHARRRIYEEDERCKQTLLESTGPKIQKVVEDELIKNRIHELVEMESGVRFMIDNHRLEELNLIYDLNRRVDDKKAETTRAIQQRIVDMGSDINKDAIAASQAPAVVPTADPAEKGKAPAQDKSLNLQTVAAIKWVEDVLALKDRFDSIWRDSFESDPLLQQAQTRSFTEFINSPTFPRSSEYISLFIDENMKKGIKGKNEAEIDAVLEKAIVLLRYVQDKDLFERYYKKHLCRRLLMNKSISNEVEKQMISKMKIELGNNFTLKLEAMFKDMTISEELTAGFKKHVEGLGEKDPKRIELSINVLTSMTWPLETMGGVAADEEDQRPRCNYPVVVDKLKRGFEKFYSQKHSGRQLTWLANMGSADIKAVFPKVPQKDGSFKERRHDLNVSTYGMVILLLFNELAPGQHMTFEEIQAQTNIPSSDLIRNLQSLAVAPKTRILIKEPMSKDVKPTDRFFFNESFQGKFVKIKVGVVSGGNKVESDRERRETEKKNDDSRGFCIEAAVVRIMKQRKELSHQQLMSETLSQLVGQFKPEVNMVKKRIESLIEREYLERVEGAQIDSYRYLA